MGEGPNGIESTADGDDIELDSLTDLPIEYLPESVYASDLTDEIFGADSEVDPPLNTENQLDALVALVRNNAGGSVDLAGRGLTELPPEVFADLMNVRVIDLSFNRLTSVPPELGSASSIMRINLSHNSLQTLPESFSHSSVIELDISHNLFTEIPTAVYNLNYLRALYASNNRIQKFGVQFGTYDLQLLDLSENKISVIPDDIDELAQLTFLRLSGNRIQSVPDRVAEMTELTDLELSGNRISVMPIDWSRMVRLEHLALSNNKYANDIEAWPPRLKDLRLDGNNLSIAPDLSSCSEYLEVLDLSNNELTTLPAEYANFESWFVLYVGKNPLQDPLPSLLERGWSAVAAYLSSLDGARALYEAKLLLVGEGEVGKSSLLAAMRGLPFVTRRETTHGIDIAPLTVNHPHSQAQRITLNAWDFGGQVVYRITHQFFFSSRAIYLLVWKPRIGHEESAIDSWLQRIALRIGTDASVIVVATHSDERRPEIDYPLLQARYPGLLRGNFAIDSQSESGIPDLVRALARVASTLPQMGQRINDAWIDVRAKISEIDEPYISRSKFDHICMQAGLDERSADALIDLLHDFGQIIYYGSDDGLRELVILQPEWLTKAIGYILEDSETRERGGILDHRRLASIWGGDHANVYPVRHHPYFVRLMEKFDVSYRLPGGTSSLVAQLVPYERPSIDNHVPVGHRFLRVVCKTSAPAPGLISWLTVRNSRYSVGLHWRRGVYLEDRSHFGRALLELAEDGLSLSLQVSAPSPQYFFDVLRSSLEHLIEERWPGIRYTLYVPCRGREGGRPCRGHFTLRALERLREREESDILCQVCVEWMDVNQLLTGFGVSEGNLATIVSRLDALSSSVMQVAARASEVARYSRAALAILSEEVVDCPRLFCLMPAAPSAKTASLSVKNKYTLQLWCEDPGHEHPVDTAKYTFKPAKGWFATVAPYARVVLRILSSLLPVAQAGVALDSSAGAAVADLSLMTSVVAAMGALTGAPGLDVEDHFGVTYEQGAGLRSFRKLLYTLDAEQMFGGMRRVQAPSGDLLWVCREHYRRYDPGLPSIAGADLKVDPVTPE